MTGKKLKELPYYERPDLTPYLIHLTKRRTKEDKALDNLIHIIHDGVINGTTSYVKHSDSKTKVACFMDVPFAALKYVCAAKNAGRYEPYGIVVQKRKVYEQKGRPVLYLSNDECDELDIPRHERWRVVAFEHDPENDTWIDWQHEREWRCPKQFDLENTPFIALVKTVDEVKELQRRIEKSKCVPLTIIPLAVICQGIGS